MFDARFRLEKGAINSDAGVQGLPCDGVRKQGKPCTPGVIPGSAKFVCITYNRTRLKTLSLNEIDMSSCCKQSTEFVQIGWKR